MTAPSRFGLLLLLFIAAIVAAPVGQVVPAQQPAPAATGTGLVAGQVVDRVTGKPVSAATVQINGRPSAVAASAGRAGAAPVAPVVNPVPVIADSQGRFFFGNLPAGIYSIQVMKSGYISLSVGPIELGDGERAVDVRARLSKLTSLSGTLRDESGDPVVGVSVIAIRRQIVNGRQSWALGGTSRSDDRGMFRLGSLQSGDYVVCACSRDPIPLDGQLLTTLGSEPLQLMALSARAVSLGSDVVSLDGSLRTWAPTFYPNASSLARAMRIAIAPGEDKTNLDMNLPLVRAVRVSGRIVGAVGPVQAGSMRLVAEADVEAGYQLFDIPPMLVQADGRFDFATVPPGQYRLIVVHRPNVPLTGPSGAAMSLTGSRGAPQPLPGATMSAAGPATTDPPQWASEPITVGENGVTGLVVSLNRSPAVSGRAVWVGPAPQPTEQMVSRTSILLQPVNRTEPLAASGGMWAGRFSPDGSFRVPGALPGKYTITANALPGFPTLKSIEVGGVNLTDLPLEIGEKDLADVVLTYVGAPMASLTLKVTNPSPTAATDEDEVLVFPADRRYWTDPAAARRRFRQMPLKSRTAMTTPELPAGDYLAVYASALDAADWMEAAKLDALSRRAQRVTVPDTGQVSVEVRR